MAARRAVAPARRRRRAAHACSGARRFTTDVERVLFALVANRAIGPVLEAGRGRVGRLRRRDPRAGGDGRGSGVPGDGPAGRGRRAGPGAGGGVLRRGRPAQPRGRPAVLRHHQHLLRTRQPRGRRGRVPRVRALQGPPPRPAADRDRPGRHPGGDPGAGVVLAGQHQRHVACIAEVKTTCAAGGSGGSSRSSTAASPATRTWPTCAAPAGTGSPASGCATAPRTRTRRCPARAATSTVRDNLRVKEVRVDDTEVRFVICHNPDEAERDRTQREDAVARLQAELDRIATARAKAGTARAAPPNARPRPRTRRPSARCATTPPSGRWLRQTPDRAAASSTGPRSPPRPTPRRQVPALHLRPRPLAPRTSRSATRTCSKPNAASAT